MQVDEHPIGIMSEPRRRHVQHLDSADHGGGDVDREHAEQPCNGGLGIGLDLRAPHRDIGFRPGGIEGRHRRAHPLERGGFVAQQTGNRQDERRNTHVPIGIELRRFCRTLCHSLSFFALRLLRHSPDLV